MNRPSAGLALPALLLCALTAACAGRPPPPVQRAGDTSVAITDDNNSTLARALHHGLKAHGWKLTHYNPKTLQEDRDYQRLGLRARYRLTLSAKRIGDCRSGDPSFLYNIALIENRTGSVAVKQAGADCLDTIIEQFESDLDRKQLDARRPDTGPGN